MTKTRRNPSSKHDGHDKGFGQSVTTKKNGSGPYNWGKLGDDNAPPPEKGDPMYKGDDEEE
eukprot:m.55678 g.55678  ORF g.55678 m.55678 type:complete len:61 (+) comp11139_c1_seq1:391-573(+)